ncbi:conserved exported hypothetical protein [Burkholderiales bacterium 8X]|nr:conserved exported hypothetical protein [Burkholderiales bacterium 8X]
MKNLTITAALIGTLGLCLFSPDAPAQGANPWDGKWQVVFKTERGTDRDGTVTVAGTAGTWDLNVAQRNDPCAGRAYPIEVAIATADELVFKVARLKTLAGCQDNTMRLKPAGEKVLEGQLSGRPFRMTKVE